MAGILVQQIDTFDIESGRHITELQVVAQPGVDQEITVGRQLVIRDAVLVRRPLAFQPGTEAVALIVQRDGTAERRNPWQRLAAVAVFRMHVVGAENQVEPLANRVLLSATGQRFQQVDGSFDLAAVKVRAARLIGEFRKNLSLVDEVIAGGLQADEIIEPIVKSARAAGDPAGVFPQ